MRRFLVLLACSISLVAGAQTSGSGFFVAPDGLLVTNLHVVEGADDVTVITAAGDKLKATVVLVHKESDLAVLRVSGTVPGVLPIRASAGIRRGEKVYALGFPQPDILGDELKVTDGLISSLSGLRDNPAMFQITNPIQPGNSGGPLITDEGQVVGVVTSSLNAARVFAVTGTLPQNVNFAVKSGALLEVLQSTGAVQPAEPRGAPGSRFTDVLAAAELAVVRVVIGVASARTERNTGGGPAPAGHDVVRIGHAGPLSGVQAHYGRDNENGVRMALEEINAQGLVIGGRKIWLELVSVDDGADPRRGARAAHELCASKVAGVVGHLNSGTTIPASRIYNDCGVPHITGSATNPSLTRPNYPTTFRIIADDNALGANLAMLAGDVLGMRRVAIVSDGSPYGAGVATSFRQTAVAKGFEIVVDQVVRNARDFPALLDQLARQPPQAVFYGGLDTEAGELLRLLQGAGLAEVALIGPDGICTQDLGRRSSGLAVLEKVICAEGGALLEKMQGGSEWKRRYDRRFPGQFQVYSPYTYDATFLLVEAMKSAGSVAPEVYTRSLAGIRYRGVTAEIAFQANGELKAPPATYYTYRRGTKIPLDSAGPR